MQQIIIDSKQLERDRQTDRQYYTTNCNIKKLELSLIHI